MTIFTRRTILAMGSGIAAAAILAACSVEPSNAPANVAATEIVADPVYAVLALPVGKAGPADYAAQLGAAKKAGAIADVTLLASKPSIEGPLGFTKLAVVQFKDEAAWTNWTSNSAPKLGADVQVKRVDLIVDSRAKAPAAGSTYVISYYSALIPAEDYAAYTREYISPNMDMQVKAGVLRGYAMYYEREADAGQPPKSLLVKEYVSEAEFDRFQTFKDKNKAELMKDPDWKRINDTKETIRKDITGTMATPVALD